MKGFATIKEVSQAWGISGRRVSILCAQGRVKGAEKVGNTWVIPKNADKPADLRLKDNKTRS